jgi:uncharacterized protein with ATP-grasp and redox domains
VKIHIDCIPCYFRQALQAARFATDDQTLWWRTMSEIAAFVRTAGPHMQSHDAAETVHRLIREATGCPDPYARVKKEYTRRALDMLPDARRRVLAAPDPLDAAVRMGIAGNVIDFGSQAFLDLDETVEKILDVPFAIDHREDFFVQLRAACTVLLLADNAGEIVFDTLLLEQLRDKRLVVCVRGAPILNDATREDALDSGLHELAEITDTGHACPGIPLERMSADFLDLFHSADIIIAKGQANFESLCEQDRANLFLLFTTKCRLVGARTGTQIGDIMLIRSDKLKTGS